MWEVIRLNQRRSWALAMALAALLAATGWAAGEMLAPGGGPWGVFGALALWVIQVELALRAGDKLFLAFSGARQLDKADHPVLFNVVEEMCIAQGLGEMPAIYLVDSGAPNAFAVGTQRPAVVVTAGLLELLTRDELQGVVAHELAHIKHRDAFFLTLLGVLVGTVVLLAEGAKRLLFYGRGAERRTSPRRGGGGLLLLAVLLIFLAPLLARLMYLALSRRREYLADAAAAVATRYPEGLASALEKIESKRYLPLPAANPVTAPMFIINPLSRAEAPGLGLFSTHPPTEERVRILRSFGGELSFAAYDRAFRQITGRPVGVIPPSALQKPPQAFRPAAADPSTLRDRLRASTDLLWRLAGYSFLACPCGSVLKVPPVYRGRTLPCPHCGRPHLVRAPAASG